MTGKFSDLRAKMLPEAQSRSAKRAEAMLQLQESRDARVVALEPVASSPDGDIEANPFPSPAK